MSPIHQLLEMYSTSPCIIIYSNLLALAVKFNLGVEQFINNASHWKEECKVSGTTASGAPVTYTVPDDIMLLEDQLQKHHHLYENIAEEYREVSIVSVSPLMEVVAHFVKELTAGPAGLIFNLTHIIPGFMFSGICSSLVSGAGKTGYSTVRC